jgi:hypothetical protein
MSGRRPLPGHPQRRVERGSEDVRTWRTRRLRAAGFDQDLAGELASDWRFDLHALLELTDRGCAPELAARIMAPLDGDGPQVA